jgi:hypothetical protein
MSDLRQRLIQAGWGQGVILDPSPFAPAKAIGFLVLNQTCDCINPDFEKEPHLELLPLERLEDSPDSKLKNGQNPRKIHFQIQENGQDIWVAAKVTDILHLERTVEQVNLEFATSYSLSATSLDDLVRWRAQRYLRAAFPDTFEKAFRSLAKGFGKLVIRHEAFIDSLLLSLSPFEEITDGETYELQLRLMVAPTVTGQPAVVKELHGVARAIEELFASSPWFDAPKCKITGLDEMTLWDARKFVDFTRYDHLSFGKEDEA